MDENRTKQTSITGKGIILNKFKQRWPIIRRFKGRINKINGNYVEIAKLKANKIIQNITTRKPGGIGNKFGRTQ